MKFVCARLLLKAGYNFIHLLPEKDTSMLQISLFLRRINKNIVNKNNKIGGG